MCQGFEEQGGVAETVACRFQRIRADRLCPRLCPTGRWRKPRTSGSVRPSPCFSRRAGNKNNGPVGKHHGGPWAYNPSNIAHHSNIGVSTGQMQVAGASSETCPIPGCALECAVSVVRACWTAHWRDGLSLLLETKRCITLDATARLNEHGSRGSGPRTAHAQRPEHHQTEAPARFSANQRRLGLSTPGRPFDVFVATDYV